MPFDTTKAPPRTSAPAAREVVRERKQAATASKKTQERTEGLVGLVQLASFGCILRGQFADAGALGKHGPNLCVEAAKLGESNEQIGKYLDALNATGPYAGLIAAALPLTLQLLANHGKIKPEALAGAGVVSPDALAAEAKTAMMRQQAEALRMQQQAELELMALAQEMQAQSPNGHDPRFEGGPHGN